MSNKPEYQKEYSLHAPAVLDATTRQLKVAKVLSILDDAGLLNRKNNNVLDIGCSGGFFIDALSEYFDRVIGIDIDSNAISLAKKKCIGENINLVVADSMSIPFSDNSIDLVICNHVYEHVPDAEKLFSEIHRTLKVDGVCYFGAASRLTLVEPHYHLLFLSWLPKKVAHFYMRVTNRGEYYYENLRTYWGIKKLINQFHINDYTLRIVLSPDKYKARDLIKRGGILEKIPLFVWKLFYKLLPGYIYILTKKSV